MNIVCTNKKASFEYTILERFEAGIKLTGTEIKSVRRGKCQITDAYVIIRNGIPYVVNMHIAKYEEGNLFNHLEDRSRELLLHQREITRLSSKMQLEGLSVVALKAYFVGSLLKLEIALARGKKLVDKRNSIKERENKRNIEKAIKERYRNS